MFDSVGGEEGTLAGILDAVEVDVQRDDIPLVGLVLADVDVIAQDRAELARPAEAQLDRGFWANARKVDGAMAGAADAIEILVEGFVEYDAYVGGSARDREMKK